MQSTTKTRRKMGVFSSRGKGTQHLYHHLNAGGILNCDWKLHFPIRRGDFVNQQRKWARRLLVYVRAVTSGVGGAVLLVRTLCQISHTFGKRRKFGEGTHPNYKTKSNTALFENRSNFCIGTLTQSKKSVYLPLRRIKMVILSFILSIKSNIK